MSWNDKNESHEVMEEKGFTVVVDGQEVPGVYWEPREGGERLVLLGHGGTTHKKMDYIMLMADQLARKGIATMAIDGPGHGERAHEGDPLSATWFQEAWHAGGGTEGMLKDWRAALDFIEAECGPRPTGWWGLSMGTMMGLPVTATDDRIKVAVLGLMGTWGPNGDELKTLAPKVTVPLRFLVQWDDEIVPRDGCIEIFGLLGSERKTMHCNPGAHSAVPKFEINASVKYLNRYLK